MAEVSPYDLAPTAAPAPWVDPFNYSTQGSGAGGAIQKGDNLWGGGINESIFGQPYGTPQGNDNQTMLPTLSYGDFNDPGAAGGSSFLKSIGWTGGDPYHSGTGLGQAMGNDSGQLEQGAYQGYTPEFQDWLKNSGLTLQQRGDMGKLGNNDVRAVDAQGNQVGDQYQHYLGNDDAFGGAMMLAAAGVTGGLATGALGGEAGAATLGAGSGAGSGMVDGAFLGEGIPSGVPAWDAAYTGAGGTFSGGAGAELGSNLPDPSDAHFTHGGDLGNMGGAGTPTIPTLNLDSGSNWLKDLYDTAKSGKGLMPGGGAGGGAGGASGPFTGGGMSPGDRYRQQLAAQAIRDLGQKDPGFQSVWSGPPQS
jgi:hypothetical protein